MNTAKEIEKTYNQVVEIRRHLHMYPELSEQEDATASYICKTLEEYHIPYTAGIAGNGIIACVGNISGNCVGIRADIDALSMTEETNLPYTSKHPGIMHACGHDMHAAILLGTAIVLKARESKLNGCVKFFFQPAEETVGGAKNMIAAGGLANPNVSRMLALHVDPVYPTGSIAIKYGPMNASAEEFDLEVKGKTCHGAHPENGIDAVIIAAQIITALQSISSRFTAPTMPVILTIGQIHGGSQNNIVCGKVTLSGTIRALNSEVMSKIMTLIPQIADGIAKSYGGSADIHWYGDMYPPLINDDQVSKVLEQTAREILGTENVHIMADASLGADDFAYFSEVVPSTYFNLGTSAEGQPFYPIHNEKFAPDENAMKVGINVLIHTALALLNQ